MPTNYWIDYIADGIYALFTNQRQMIIFSRKSEELTDFVGRCQAEMLPLHPHSNFNIPLSETVGIIELLYIPTESDPFMCYL